MKQHSGCDSYDNAPVRARRSARSRAGRNLKLNKAPTTLVQLHEHQKKASKKRKMARGRARRKCERAEYLQLKAEKLSLSNKGGSGTHKTTDQPDEKNALFPGEGREPLLERAKQQLERKLRANSVQPEQVAPPALYAGFEGEDDTCKLVAMLLAQGWVDPRNVAIWGVTLIEWCDWDREKKGPEWVVDDGLVHSDIDYTCAPLNIVSRDVMRMYEQGKKRFEVRAGAASAKTRASRRSAASAERGIKMYLRCNALYKGLMLELQVARVL